MEELDPLGEELDLILPITTQEQPILLSDFDQFSEDSIERDRIRNENLEDSLELMKQEENINKTAFFGEAVTDREEETVPAEEGGHNYSFSNDI